MKVPNGSNWESSSRGVSTKSFHFSLPFHILKISSVNIRLETLTASILYANNTITIYRIEQIPEYVQSCTLEARMATTRFWHVRNENVRDDYGTRQWHSSSFSRVALAFWWRRLPSLCLCRFHLLSDRNYFLLPPLLSPRKIYFRLTRSIHHKPRDETFACL